MSNKPIIGQNTVFHIHEVSKIAVEAKNRTVVARD